MAMTAQTCFTDEITVDGFCGGGGWSTGFELAIGRPVDIGINHDAAAIALHKKNHPYTRHYNENIWEVDPRTACAGRPVGWAHFSPDCKHFSRAKGAKPVSKKIRGLAWVVLKWAGTVYPRIISMENVVEFMTCPTFRPRRVREGKLGEHTRAGTKGFAKKAVKKPHFFVKTRPKLKKREEAVLVASVREINGGCEMKKRIYPVLFTETAGVVLVEVPDLEILTEGTDMADAIEMARDAIGQRGVLLEDKGETLRVPSSMETIHPENGTFAEDGKTIVSLVDVDFEEYRRKNDNKMVRRNVTIPNWMDREAAREKINVSGVLREALAERLQANR